MAVVGCDLEFARRVPPVRGLVLGAVEEGEGVGVLHGGGEVIYGGVLFFFSSEVGGGLA